MCRLKIYGFLVLCFASINIFADTKISILDFELKDLILAPRIASELERTASIKCSFNRKFIKLSFYHGET